MMDLARTFDRPPAADRDEEIGEEKTTMKTKMTSAKTLKEDVIASDDMFFIREIGSMKKVRHTTMLQALEEGDVRPNTFGTTSPMITASAR
jgi:hypothetical protein